MIQKRPIVTLTWREFNAQLDEARAEQIEQDACTNFEYFHTAAMIVLHDTFGFGGKVRLPRFFDALDEIMQQHKNLAVLKKELKDKTTIELELGETVEENER